MACTDDRAFELVEAGIVAGIKIPEEVAILGVDNDDLVCEIINTMSHFIIAGLRGNAGAGPVGPWLCDGSYRY